MSFDPYHQWLGIPPAEQPPNHYRLLGVADFESDPDVISNAAYRQLAHVKTYQLGQHVADSQRLLSEIVTARACLLNADARAAYDSQLRQASTPPPAPPIETPRLSVTEPARRKQNARAQPLVAVVSCAVVLVAVSFIVAVVILQPKPGNVADQTSQSTIAPAPGQLPENNGAVASAQPQPQPPEEAVIQPSDGVDVPNPQLADPPADPLDPRSTEVPAPQDSSTEPEPEPEPTPVVIPNPTATTPPATAPPAKLPIPNTESQAATLALVKELYQKEYEDAESFEQKSAAAKKVLSAADETGIDVTARYVLLSVARNMAVQAGDPDTSFVAIEALDEQYEVDALTMREAALQTWSKMTMPKEARADLARLIPPVAEAAVAQERYDVAVNLLQLARDTARRADDIQLAKDVAKRLKEVDAIAAQFAEVREALETLASDPTDEKANDVAGRYFCLAKGDWSRGLPLLERGSDAKWQAAAERDLRGAGQADEQLGSGDMWWDLAQHEQDTSVARQLLARAAYWYLLAAPNLNGLAKTKCEKRITDAYLATGNMLGGQAASSFRTRSGLEFDGNAWVETDLQYDGRTPLTIETWATPAAHDLRSVVANNHGLGLALQIGEDGHWGFAVRDKQDYRVATSNEIARLGELVHVAGVFDGRIVRLFVNGQLQDTVGTLTSGHKVSNLRFMIGADPDFNSRPQKHFLGSIDSVHVSYAVLYDGNFTPPDPLVRTPSTALLLQFDEGEGDVAADTSGHEHHATIHDAKWVTSRP